MIAAAMLAGAILMALPALAKTRFGVDEVVTTLLLNFIVLLFVSMMLDGPMKDPTAMGWPQSVALDERSSCRSSSSARASMPGSSSAIALCVLTWAAMRLTTFGFEVRAVGANARAARFAGVPVTRTLMLVAIASGAVAGLAGAIEVAGAPGYVTLDMSPGYGYTGIVIAMLAGLNPLGVIAAARVRGRHPGRGRQHEPGRCRCRPTSPT
jgi:simple sugar transport system permease protein